MPVPEIYPFSLGPLAAEALVLKHARSEFEEKTRWHTARAEYDFSADVHENGEVKLRVWYSDFDGFCHSGGGLLNKVVRPFNDEYLASLKDSRMTSIARMAYLARKEREEEQEIRKIKAELFGIPGTDGDDDGPTPV